MNQHYTKSPFFSSFSRWFLHMRVGVKEIAHYTCAISRLRKYSAQSRDCASIVRNLEIRTQSRDSENAQRNLEIAQILRLRGAYAYMNVDV